MPDNIRNILVRNDEVSKTNMKEWMSKYKEIIVYVAVGALTTFVNWICYAVGVEVLSLEIGASNVIAWAVSVLFAYITNKIWVFQSETKTFQEIVKELGLFVGARVTTGVLETFAVPFLVWCGLNQEIFGITGMLSKIVVSFVVLVTNYLFSKFIIFRKKA